MDEREHLDSKIVDWDVNNINTNKFDDILNDITNKKPNAEKNFIFELESEWVKYKKFADEMINELLSIDTPNKNHIMDIVRINDFIFFNKYEINKIIKIHDKISEYKIYPSWRWKINYDNSKKLYPLLKNISNLYQDQNLSTEEKLKTNDFSRKSSKYWVRRDKLIPIILNIIEHLPIFIWDEEINDHIYQHIYSVYLDNNDCDMFNKRIDKENNSKLIRFRWYEDNMDNIFVERKVHFDDWTLLESKKNRFELNSQHILSYLKNDMVVDNQLAKEISEEILTNKLYPKIRTEYKRISFQLPNNNSIRISIDIDLKLIREKVSHLDWFTSEENLLQDDIHSFPFHILEVKLMGDNISNPPEWVTEIINSDLVISQPYFSKFLHGSYVFFSEKCQKKPYWIEQNNDLFERAIEKNRIKENNINQIERRNNCFDFCIPVRNANLPLSAPMKIEPKSYFANERTYLQWFNGSAFVASAGTALMSMKERETGIILITMSVMVLFYSTVIYYKRGHALENHISTGYNDKFGPYFLTFIMAAAFISSAFIIN